MDSSSAKNAQLNIEEEKSRQANYCLSLGIGVGALGVASAAAAGAVCPICVVVAPALIGLGVVEKVRSKRRRSASEALHHSTDTKD